MKTQKPISVRQRFILTEKLPDEKECMIIDEQLSDRTGSEIAAAWQNLCGCMVAETCKTMRRDYIRRKDEVMDKVKAKKWLDGGGAVITFEDVCLTLGIDKQRTKKAIDIYAHKQNHSPINRSVFCALNPEG
jgi:hypothetical protein